MPRVDFVPDVDGFAFANNWSFDDREKQEIRDIVQAALPAAAALLSPIVMAAAPLIAPVAGIALGPVLPLIAVAGPFLVAAAPKISELIVNAIVDHIAKGGGRDNLCGGMMSAALDYHRLGWVPPRGLGRDQTPQFDPNAPDSIESWLRKRIWEGQIDNHIDDTPRMILWKAVGVLFGDWGHDWLRDQTRDELAKMSAALTAGIAIPVGILWNDSHSKGFDIGHIVVGYGLEWYGPDRCSLTVCDNEYPDAQTIFDIDLSVSPPLIVDRSDNDRRADGVFLGGYRQKTPPPVIVRSTALSITPSTYLVQGEPLDAAFGILNKGFSELRDGVGGLRNVGSVVAPPMAWQLPTKPDPATPPYTPPYAVKMLPVFAPIAAGADEPIAADTAGLPPGNYILEPVVMAGSNLTGTRIARTLADTNGNPAATVTLRVNPKIPIRERDAHKGFGCARPRVEGTPVTLEADLSALIGRGIQSVTWTVTGALTMTASGPTLYIAALPPAPGHCEIKVSATLSDGTEARGWATWTLN